MTETAVRAYASPAPVFVVDDRDDGRLGRDLLRLDVKEGRLGLRTLVARFHAVGPDSDGSAAGLSYLDGDVFDIGSSLAAVIGLPGAEREVFTGTVSALEVSFREGSVPYVSVFAEDALMRLRLRERTATYTDMTDSDIASEIASEHGLGAAAEASGPTYPTVQQWQQSDLGFLRDRALRLNAEIWVDSQDTLHFADREQRRGAELELVQGNELVSVQLRADLAHQRSDVEFRGWDDSTVEAVSESVGADVIAAEVAGVAGLAGGGLGPEVVADVFGDVPLSRVRQDVLSSATAQAYAEAEMRRRARSFVTVDGTTSGTPDLVPGAKLDLRRVGRPFEGAGYRVTFAHHSYDLTTGYRTAFRAERAVVSR